MTSLVQINQGTAPAGSDGDTVRSAFAKVNANTAALATQVPLVTTYLPDANATLDATYAGKRVCLNMSVAGRTVVLPRANSVGSDQCFLLWTLSNPVVVGFQGSDGSEVSQLSAGDWIVYVSDGNAYWHVQQRGRNSWNETVGGTLTVGSTITVGGSTLAFGPVIVNSNPLALRGPAGVQREIQFQTGTTNRWKIFADGSAENGSNSGSNLYIQALSDSGAYLWNPFTISRATGRVQLANGADVAGNLTVNRTSGEGDLLLGQNDGYFFGSATQAGWYSGTVGNFSYIFAQRNLYINNNAVWHAGNLANPTTTDTTQTVTGAKTFSATSAFTGAANFSGPYGGTYTTSTVNLFATSPVSGIGFNSGGYGATLAYAGGSPGMFQFMDYQRSGYLPITCSTLTQASDSALKTDVASLSCVLEKLRNKRTVFYVLKSDPGKTRHIGVIAQEWQEDFPELVTDAGVDIDDDGDFIAHQYDKAGNEIFGPNGKPQSRRALGFNYSNASALALQGVIDLEAALSAALARIEALEAK